MDAFPRCISRTNCLITILIISPALLILLTQPDAPEPRLLILLTQPDAPEPRARGTSIMHGSLHPFIHPCMLSCLRALKSTKSSIASRSCAPSTIEQFQMDARKSQLNPIEYSVPGVAVLASHCILFGGELFQRCLCCWKPGRVFVYILPKGNK
jgi:hypothetical protein